MPMPAAPLMHIYLSPHLDDAVFSCGALIHHQVQAGARVVVVTVCSGNPPAGPLSPFAQSLHERWLAGLDNAVGRPPAEVAALRRSEDLAALAHLDAEAVHLDIPDSIYRVNPATHWATYASEAAIFGALHPSELTLIRRVAAKLTTLLRGFGRQHIYVPLAAGNHVDHQLTRRVAEVAGGIFAYYEDQPYVLKEGDRWPNLQAPALAERRLAADILHLADDDLAAWTAASARYASQISSFWADAEAMALAFRQYAARTGGAAPAVRLWRPA